jgi:diguanylate cyclase (GGDEF)-like protein/PAS domain S-box-containing protein
LPKTLPRAPKALESDAWFRVLADHTSVGLFAYREHILWANRAAELLTGYSLAELQEKPVWDLFAADYVERVRERVSDRLRGHGLDVEQELPIVTRSGEVRWIAMTADVIEGEDGPFALGTAYDVTDRRRSESALRDREERLVLAQRASHSVVWEWDLVTDAVIVPDWFAGFFGDASAAAPLLGTDFVALVHPDDRPALHAALLDTLKGDKDLDLELRVSPPDGGTLWIAERAHAVRDADGRVTRLIGVARDITARKQVETALRQSEEQYRQLVDQQTDLVVRLDRGGRLAFFSPSVSAFFQSDLSRLLGRRFIDVTPEEERPAARAAARQLLRQGTAHFDQRLLVSGRWRWVSWNAKAVRQGKRLSEFIAVGRDVTERKLSEEALFQEKERAQVTLAAIGDGVIRTDAEGRIDFLNPAAETLTGWKTFEAYGRTVPEVFSIVDPVSHKPAPDPVEICLREERTVTPPDNRLLRRADGAEFVVRDTASPITSRAGRIIGAILVFKDLTALRGMEREVAYLASYDPLTALLNRREFEKRLEHALRTAGEQGGRHALCYFDIDQFKVVNDTCGHTAGDELLKQIGALLQWKAPEGVTLARLGGDEFGALIEHRPLSEARRIAQSLRQEISRLRFRWQDRTFETSASIGLVPIGPGSGDLTALMIAADAACYAAKEGGRNRLHEWEPDDTALAERSGEMQWIHRIHRAFDEKRFRLYAQPIVPMRARHTLQLSELVLRLIGEDGEIVLPNEFIPAAERYRLVPAIDRWVVHNALIAIAGHPDTTRAFTINLSGQSLSEESFLEYVVQKLASAGVPTERVFFEITETAAIAHHGRAMNFISILRGMGCRFVLDDFGTGFSTFAYLKNLPVDFLKIDGEFVRDITTNRIHEALVESINQVGHVMGICTIAEAVEDGASLATLDRLGVDYAQGYHLARPAPLPELV